MYRKTILILSLAVSLVAALIAIVMQDDLRERLGDEPGAWLDTFMAGRGRNVA